MYYRFSDRAEAGQALVKRLSHLANEPGLIILALPRGGVPIGYEIARGLHAPLDIFLVRKLGVPGYTELAMGALAENGARFINQQVIRQLGISEIAIEQIAAQEQQELQRRERIYRGHNRPPDVTGHTVIIVDDGLATGATVKVAVQALRSQRPKKIVVAVPVGAPDTCEEIRRLVDEFICLVMPEPFHAVGIWYESFPQLSDADVIRLLEQDKSTTSS